MIVVYSFIKNPLFFNENQQKYAFISNALIKRLGYKTILYTDEKSANFFNTVPFDERLIFNQKDVDELPTNIWSAAKILALSHIETPFIHLDFDCFIFNNKFEDAIRDKKFFYFHNEVWEKEEKNKPGVDFILNNTQLGSRLSSDSLDLISKNLAVFGTQDRDQALLINKQAKNMISSLKNDKLHFFDNERFLFDFEKISGMNKFILTVLVEQIIFYNMCTHNLAPKEKGYITNNHNLTASHILADFDSCSYKESGILHLWGHKYSKGVGSLLEKLNKYLK
jgi:hypothetical protein